MDIVKLIRQLTPQPVDTAKLEIPKRDLPTAPVGGIVPLTSRDRFSAAQGPVVGSRARQISGDTPNEWNGEQQLHQETRGGAGSLKVKNGEDALPGELDVWEHHDFFLTLSADTSITFTIGNADTAPGAIRANSFVARSWWISLEVEHNGFDVFWPDTVWWDADDGAYVPDLTTPRWIATFRVKQLGIGSDPEVTFGGARAIRQ